jgi:hypothetical protein
VELGSARELKAHVLDGLEMPVRASAAAPTTVAVGVVPRPRGFGLALRVTSADVLALPSVEDVLKRYGDEAEVRVVGPVRAATGTGAAGSRLRWLVLHPGASVAHPDVTAGTLGAFVRDGDGRVLLLSNNHVLADTDRAQVGDPVLSPGPADGGRRDLDRVATLTSFECLSAGRNLLDLAVAAVDDPAHVGGNEVPEGTLSGVVEELLDGVLVAKVGRTTGHTTGTVTAIELDGVTVDYGRRDVFTFDECLEVEGDLGAFSDGGDSGSVVYDRESLAAVGLLFAGSSAGGANGAGLTFCNPAALALRTAQVTLL